MTHSTRTVILLGTAVVAMLFGMAIAATVAPVRTPYVRHMTLIESLTRNGFAPPLDIGDSFVSMLTGSNVIVRGFAPAVVATKQDTVALTFPTPVIVHTHATVTPHVTTAHATHVRLSQIPYTGFDYGPLGNAIYWFSLVLFALSAGYLLVYSQSRVYKTLSQLIRGMAFRIDAVLGL